MGGGGCDFKASGANVEPLEVINNIMDKSMWTQLSVTQRIYRFRFVKKSYWPEFNHIFKNNSYIYMNIYFYIFIYLGRHGG